MIEIKKAAEIIKKGGVVAFPTETVYGLGADAANQQACLNIYKLKNRPGTNPLIVHVSTIKQAQKLAEFNDDAKKISNLWPGPITLVLPKKQDTNIAECVTAGLDTIALRIPADLTALNLINEAGCVVAAPSANISGRLSSTTVEHVKKNFGSEVFTLNSNKDINRVGLESTIIDLTSAEPTILRQGFFTQEMLEKTLNKKISIAEKGSKIKAPGMLLKHYAPLTDLRLNATSLNENEVGLNFGNSGLNAEKSINLSASGDLSEASLNLYEYLHILDSHCQKNKIASIAVASIPNSGIGIAINDRLSRAAYK